MFNFLFSFSLFPPLTPTHSHALFRFFFPLLTILLISLSPSRLHRDPSFPRFESNTVAGTILPISTSTLIDCAFHFQFKRFRISTAISTSASFPSTSFFPSSSPLSLTHSLTITISILPSLPTSRDPPPFGNPA